MLTDSPLTDMETISLFDGSPLHLPQSSALERLGLSKPWRKELRRADPLGDITPPGAVTRRTVISDGMTAQLVQTAGS